MCVKADQQILLSIILKFFFTLMNSFYVFFPELKRRRQMFCLSDKIEILCDIYYSI